MKKKTQINDVYIYLKKHKRGITSMIAIDKFGCTRLSSCIHDLRNKGVNITTVMENVPTRYGKTCRIARYILEG